MKIVKQFLWYLWEKRIQFSYKTTKVLHKNFDQNFFKCEKVLCQPWNSAADCRAWTEIWRIILEYRESLWFFRWISRVLLLNFMKIPRQFFFVSGIPEYTTKLLLRRTQVMLVGFVGKAQSENFSGIFTWRKTESVAFNCFCCDGAISRSQKFIFSMPPATRCNNWIRTIPQ
jgi:hypothetical protein